MIRSLYTGATGLKGFQRGLDNIGNNVANVNTTAYKSSSTTFSDVLSQNMALASAATKTSAGVNAKQVGLGMKVGATTVNVTKAGAAQVTGDTWDFRIDGSSFFIVHKGDEEFYTKDGTFEIDHQGNLVTRNSGYYVMGWTSTDGKTVNPKGAVGKLNIINVEKDKEDTYAEATSAIRVEGNLDYKDEGLYSANGRTLDVDVYGSDGSTYTLRLKFYDNNDADQRTFQAAIAGYTDSKGVYTAATGGTVIPLEFSNTGALVSAGGDTKGIGKTTLPAALGGGAVEIDFSKLTCNAASAIDVEYKGGLPDWVSVDADSLKNGYLSSVYKNNQTYTKADGTTVNAEIEHAASNLDFSSLTDANKSDLINNGFYFTCCTCDRYYSVNFVSGDTSSLTMTGRHYIYNVGIDNVHSGEDLVNAILTATGASDGEKTSNPESHYSMLVGDGAKLTIYDDRSTMNKSDFSEAVSWDDSWKNPSFNIIANEKYGQFGKGVAVSKKISDNTNMTSLKGDADGYGTGLGIGKRNGTSTDFTGKIYALYDNGGKRLIGQMAVADFQNPTGLEKTGDNLYGATMNTGTKTIHEVDENNGRIISGQVEMSNVDLATEMSNLIIMQRAFQANSRIITTSDGILQTVSDLKR